ncbi:putative glycosyl transferases [Staphylococcus piscifermentans]|uniref:Glycosyl transferase family 1 n=3 Tax=Staphylococcus piscifermentans TaxID=70258 RepID=A0A239TL33_9STAP|nr:glycosyltransferase [Staphylococcus piscifermentans]GEP85220.1 glycosyl transferase family 1 [Staphylococcus piscifermentans]SNU98149.1 putative glycosyl transferases [Staphylococcus piscifermentans]
MKKLVPIVFLHNIKKVNGGLHKAAYHRINTLSKVYKRAIIFTYGFDPEFQELCKYHKEVGNIAENVEIYNLYENNNADSSTQKYEKNPNYTYFADAKQKNTYRVFDEKGRYHYYLRLHEDGTANFKDVFTTPWKRYLKEIYGQNGKVRKAIYMDDRNKPSFNVLYSNEGKPVVSSSLHKDNFRPVNYFCHLNERQYTDEISMGVDVLKEFIKDIPHPLLFIEKREHVKPFNRIKGANIKKIYILHNNHLDTPFTDIHKFSPSVDDLFESIENDEIDKLVVLTKEQQEDINKIKHIEDKIKVISHHQPKLTKFMEKLPENKDPLIISLARYHNAKNLPEAIDIVKEVVKKIPKVRFEIYGYGPDKEKLQKQIDDAGLKDNIFLKGHVNNTIDRLKQAKLYLSTSNYEGFPLALLESLACGVPIVSYNTKYGPIEIIRENKDGFVIDKLSNDRIKQAAEKVIQILQMPENEYKKMQKNALEITKRQHEKKINKLWLELLDELS